MLGQVVGNYRVLSELGVGGMGAVYLAEHTLLGRKAAIKVLLRQFSHEPRVVERFFNEAKATTAINNLGIVEIYDFGYHTDGSAYIVMEYLRGESLAQRLSGRGIMPSDRAIAILRQLCVALRAAHEESIVHRDLKPDNIFLIPDAEVPGGERIKILDFGIAKLTSGPLSNQTATGAVMGTPTYMAPEQCRGAGQVDLRADLYALGCILFEMVCGQAPFVREGAGAVLGAHMYEQPPAPETMNRAVSGELSALIHRLLAKEPDHRPQSCTALIEALDGLRGTAGTTAGTTAPIAAAIPASSGSPTGPVQTTLGSAAGVHASPTVSGTRTRSKVLALTSAVLLATAGVVIGVVRSGDQSSSETVAAAEPETRRASEPGSASPEPDGRPKATVVPSAETGARQPAATAVVPSTDGAASATVAPPVAAAETPGKKKRALRASQSRAGGDQEGEAAESGFDWDALDNDHPEPKADQPVTKSSKRRPSSTEKRSPASTSKQSTGRAARPGTLGGYCVHNTECAAGLECNARSTRCERKPAQAPATTAKPPAKPGTLGGYCVHGRRCNAGLACDPSTSKCTKAE